MTQPIHPSPDSLSAFLDQELPTDERTQIDQHLSGCGECRSTLSQFKALEDLGPLVEERMPTEAYWLDLPDRILVRLNTPEVTVPEEASVSWWRRMWNAPTGWRVGFGAAMASALAVAAFGVMNRPSEVPQQHVASIPVAPLGLSSSIDGLESGSLNPEAFAERVITTLGRRGDLGTPLGLVDGEAPAVDPASEGGLASPVSMSLPPLGPEARSEAEGVLSYGCGESPIDKAFLAAIKAEETGNYDLARQGYQVVRAHTDSRNPLYWEAHFRYSCNLWQQKLLKTAPQLRARALADLGREAQRSYARWTQTGQQKDCEQAYCLNRVFLKLGAEGVQNRDIQATNNRMGELLGCGK